MLQNAYFLAKIGANTAENEQHFAEILPIGRRVADRRHPRRIGRPRPDVDERVVDAIIPPDKQPGDQFQAPRQLNAGGGEGKLRCRK